MTVSSAKQEPRGGLLFCEVRPLMDRFCNSILRRHRLVIILFAIASVICAFLFTGVVINYDMVDYLPQNAPSTHALTVMESEFTQSVPNARVMIEGVDIQEALAYKKRLAAIDGVSDVMWLDDVVDIKQPLEQADQSYVDGYYRGDTALITLTVGKGLESPAIAAIYEIIGERGAVSGDAAASAAYQALSSQESLKAIVCLIPVVILILLVSTRSWLEPVLFLLTIGVAVIINMGSNLIFDNVSYVTFAISPILQMAVSLDYAIFLLHSFEAFREQTNDVNEAMRLAIRRSFPSVLASALTTLLGFLVLILMRFRLGADLGLNLAKGIVLSLISAMIFLPALTISCLKYIDKTRHRSFMPSFRRAGKVVAGLRAPVLILVLLLLVPAYLGQRENSFTYGTGDLDRNTRAGADEQRILDEFGASTPIVVLVPKGEYAREVALCNEYKEMRHITSVISYATAVGIEIPSDYLDKSIVSQFYSENYCRIILYAATPNEGELAFQVVEQVRAAAARYYGDAPLTCGQSMVLYDMRDVVESDNSLVNLLAVLTIGLVLMLTFKSVSLPLILLLTIETAIWINLSIPYFSNIALCYIGYLVISTVQLGATVDYAILYTDHYVSSRYSLPPLESIYKTANETTGSILVSGTILSTAGFIIGFSSTNEIVSALGTLIGRGALMSLALVLLFLPAELTALDPLIRLSTVKADFCPKRKRLK